MPEPAQSSKVKVTVPATTANLGPGFDCLGMALDLHNEFVVERLASHPTVVEGHGTCAGLTDPDNLFVWSFQHAFKKAGGVAPAIRLDLYGNIPLSRGLGSSATAVVGGLLAADTFLGQRFTGAELLEQATEIEGHPDNVAPALLGGLTASVKTSRAVLSRQYRPHRDWRVALLIPSYELSTKAAREAIPKEIPHGDAVFNLARVPFILDALVQGDARELSLVMEDRLHEPYRKNLIRDYDPISAAAREAGAAATYLSGAGPTIAALCLGHTTAEDAAAAMLDAARAADSGAKSVVLRPHSTGADAIILR